MATDLIFSRSPITGTPVHLVFGGSAPPPAGGGIKAFNGTAWVTATVKRWNGTAWVETTVKRRSATQWQ